MRRNPEYDRMEAVIQEAFGDYMSHLCFKCIAPFVRCQEKQRLRDIYIQAEREAIKMEVYVD